MINRIFIYMTLTICISACTASPMKISDAATRDYEGFKPRRELVKVTDANVYDANTKTRVDKDWAELSIEEQRRDLSLIESQVAVFSVDNSGQLSYLGSQVSASKGTYVVMVDYTRHRTQEIKDNDILVGIAKIGVGLRVSAEIKTRKAGLNISGLLPIAAAFENNQVSGYINATTIGIIAPDASKYFVPSSVLDRSSLEKALESLGSIRVIMDDDKTEFQPYLLALSKVVPGMESSVIKSITD